MFANTALLLALGAVAVQADQTLDLSSISNSCPSGWSANSLGDSSQIYCCPGSAIQIDDTGACCIGYGTMGPRGTCGTTVAYNDPNYSSIVSSLAAETSGGSSPSTNMDATMTGSGSTFETSVSMDVSNGFSTSIGMTDSGSGAGAAETGASSTSSGSGVAITAAPLLANVLLGAAGAAMLL